MSEIIKDDLLNLLMKRRSIRKYKDKAIEKEKIDSLIKSALLAPSSRGIRPWEFIIVENKEILEKLSKCKLGAQFLEGAALGIVVTADNTKSDVWIEDTAIASTLIQLEAENLGLGSCWIQIRNRNYDENTTAEEYIRGALEIPENYSVESIISIGYADEKRKPYSEAELKYDKVHKEKY